MRVLITRPETEAARLAQALTGRGHQPILAPLFRLQPLPPPPDLEDMLAQAQAVLLSSANGAEALARVTERRGMAVLAVGDTTAATAEGLGFTSVHSASGDGAALADLARTRLDPAGGPILHVGGAEIATDFAEALEPAGFAVGRVTLYEAEAVEALPDSARAALQARAVDVAPFFSARAAQVFADLVTRADLAELLRPVRAVAISPAVAHALDTLPFASVDTAERPTKQAVLEALERAPQPAAPSPEDMTMTEPSAPEPATPPPPRRGVGAVGAFLSGLVGAALVMAATVASLPFWPQSMQALWRGSPPKTLSAADARAEAVAATDAARRDLGARLDDLERRVRAAQTTLGEIAARPAPTPTRDPAIGELSQRVESLERRPATIVPPPAPAPAPAGDTDKDVAALRQEIAGLRAALAAVDQSAALGREEATRLRGQAQTLATSVERLQAQVAAAAAAPVPTGGGKAEQAARASAVVAIAARLSSAIETGQPFATELRLLPPLAGDDATLKEIVSTLQPLATSGVAARAALVADFPAMARNVLAADLADDSFGERVLGKLRALVSLRRVGADVAGDGAEARLARAEAALDLGDIARALELVQGLPAIAAPPAAAWRGRAEAHIAARRAADRLAAHAVTLLGAAR